MMNFSTFTTTELRGHRRKIFSVGWSCDGRKLASGSADGSLRVWTFNDKYNPKDSEFAGHTDSINQLVWDPTDADRLVTASSDKTVKIWDTRNSRRPASTVSTNGDNINVAWSPEGKYIAVVDKGNHLRFIDVKTNKILKTVTYQMELNEIKWNNTGELVFVTADWGLEVLKTPPSLKRVASVGAHSDTCFAIDFDPTGKHCAVGSADALTSIWDVEEMVCVRTIQALPMGIRAVSFSGNGKYIASASEDPVRTFVIDISDVETGESVHQLVCSAPMNTIAWHPKRLWLAYAGEGISERRDEGCVRIFGENLPGTGSLRK